MVPRSSRCVASLHCASPRTPIAPFLSQQWLRRTFHGSSCLLEDKPKIDKKAARRNEVLNTWRQYNSSFPADSPDGTYYGFLRSKRNQGKHLSFGDLTTPSGEDIQICSNLEGNEEAHESFRRILKNTPVLIRAKKVEQTEGGRQTVHLDQIQPLNSFPERLIVTNEVVFPPEKRHFQIRYHPELRARLEFRSWLKSSLNQSLLEKGFMDIETPTLFKSTPEGAREFLVPVRAAKKSKAYALSQSPQQYKQALMGSGVTRYMQWARCYRDEDARTDRQPEFTQLDMEWAFAGAEKVQKDVGDIVKRALTHLRPSATYEELRGQRVPVVRKLAGTEETAGDAEAHTFTHMTHAECLEAHGSDKPDLRIPGRIHAIRDIEPIREFVKLITDLPDPEVEGFAFTMNDSTAARTREFIINFMEELPETLKPVPEGAPQILVFDTKKPLAGMSPIGHEYEDVLDQIAPGMELDNGDIVVFQAREKVQGQQCASSTKLGEVRRLLWKALVDAGLMETPKLGEPGSMQFLWVTEFPMFKMVEQGEPGQGGAAGIAAAHHPFTAPLSEKDLEYLLDGDVMQAKSAAYDLVLNGVEIGGGSVRNHVESVQRYIMTDVLKMEPERVKDFNHLFEVLAAGCPPHAGFALGFDRMVALMSGTTTVRDVIAFPKTMKGEDLFVGSPSTVTQEQLAPYNMQLGKARGVSTDV